MIRHGDVHLVEVDKLPDDAVLLKGRKELAYRAVTGHAHRIDVGELFQTKNRELYLRVEKLSKLSHEEHGTIILKAKIYRVGQKRQYTPAGWENVKD